MNLHNLIFLTQAIPEGRVFGLDSQTLIGIGIQLFNAILLSVVLGYLLYNPVKNFLQNRTNKIKNAIEQADATMAEANELIAKYNAKLDSIEKERTEVLKAAHQTAADQSRVIIAEAHDEANKTKQRALDSVLADQKRFKQEARQYIIELASLMAEQYITTNVNDEANAKFFQESLDQLEEVQWKN